jgi:hypothetical protein
MLELQNLQNRVPFGPANDPGQCTAWNPPVARFDLAWLKGSFVPAQRDRLGKITGAIQTANGEVEKLRAAFVVPKPSGQRQPNGNVLLTGEDHSAARTIRTHAQNQLVRDVIALREPLEKIVYPILRDMSRASFTVDTLRERVFSREACLSRASLTSLDRAGFAALKANYAIMLKHLAPIELFAAAQRALDSGSAEDLPFIDAIRVENFRRPKDSRAFLNAKLIELVNIPEWNDAQPLLDEVQSANKQALLLWAQFQNHSSRVNLMKLSLGLNKFGVKDPNDPYADLG